MINDPDLFGCPRCNFKLEETIEFPEPQTIMFK